MTRDIFEPNGTNEQEAIAFNLTRLVQGMGLQNKITIEPKTTRSGQTQIIICGNRSIAIDSNSGLEKILKGQVSLLINTLAKSLGNPGKDVDSCALLQDQSFANACLANIESGSLEGNSLLTSLGSERIPDRVPVYYGSTYGFNFAELAETVRCAEALQATGISPMVVFDTTGNETQKADQILAVSYQVISPNQRSSYLSFEDSLGKTKFEQRANAAMLLMQSLSSQNIPVQIVDADNIYQQLGNTFTLGKLLVIARLAGQNPRLFESYTMDYLLKLADQQSISLTAPVTDIHLPQGFTSYARDAVVASDFPGAMATPLKMTTHANIYKVLKDYGSLFNAERKSGMILCPITKNRIQVRQQVGTGDPCDVVVLAFLAQTSPSAFDRLMNDFNASCKVLRPEEAIALGTKDRKFIIEDYF